VSIDFFSCSFGLDAPELSARSFSRSHVGKREREKTYLRVMAKWLPLSMPSSKYLSEYSKSPILDPLSPLSSTACCSVLLPGRIPLAVLQTPTKFLPERLKQTRWTVTARLSFVPQTDKSWGLQPRARDKWERQSWVSRFVLCRVKWMYGGGLGRSEVSILLAPYLSGLRG
jgi:hypothetical protein